MTSISLRNIQKTFGKDTQVIKDVNLEIADGEFCVFLGPSGCGKSTLLRMVAGIEDVTAGELLIGGVRMNEVPAAKRQVAMVFQSYALYPHMSVYENMAFGLRQAKVDKGEIDRRVKEAAQILQLEPLLERTPLGTLPLASKGRSYVEQAKVPLPDRMQMYNLLLRLGVGNVFEPDFLAQVNTGDPLRQQQAVWQQVQGASTLNRMLAFDWRYTLAEADLPKVCGTTSLAGVAVGFPFLDPALLAFSMRLPTDYKLNGLKLRWFFKEALRGFLPDEILTKKKQGFGLPFGVWANRHAGLRKLATDSLHSLAGRGIVRPDFITKLIKEHLPAHPGYYGEMIWILMMLEQWLQGHA